jgi:hypothetical protein
MTPDAIIAAAVRNRANRKGQVCRLQPVAILAREKQHELARKLADLRGVKEEIATVSGLSNVPDFFPTPATLVARMVAEAGLQGGMRVLEPSAGKGDIAKAARAAGCAVVCIEQNFTLCGILIGAGFETHAGDFLTYDAPAERFDRALMNPPFSGGADARHVMHAFHWLKPGGRLAAICCEGAFFRGDKLSAQFRDFVDEHGSSEKLPPGTFNSAQCYRGTGVNTRIVILDK